MLSLIGTLIHPVRLIEYVAEQIWPLAEGGLDRLNDHEYKVLESMYNLVAIVLIHQSLHSITFGWLYIMLLLLGIGKLILLKRRAKIKGNPEMHQCRGNARSKKTGYIKMPEKQVWVRPS